MAPARRSRSVTSALSARPVPADLDDLDRRILAVLQLDASLSNLALASRVHASPATCLRRVRRLIDEGVIERQVAIVSPRALGPTLTAILEITLDRQGDEHLDAFEARAAAEPAVLQCYRVSPGPDFVLIAQVRDMPGYQALAARLLRADANVRNVRSYFAIRRAKFDTRVPDDATRG